MDEDLLAFPDARAAKLAGVSVRRLRYWEEHELVVPSIKRIDAAVGRMLRQRCSVGHHVWLRCPDWEACDLPSIHLDDVTSRLQARSNLTVRVSKDGLSDSSG